MSLRDNFCLDHPAPYPLPFVTTALSILFMLITVPGNALILKALFQDPYGNLRTPFNNLVFNLAVADILVGLIADPLSIVYHLDEGLSSSLPRIVIKIEHVSYLTACTASVLTVASMTVDRYIAVIHPTRYKAYQTKERVSITVVAIWVISCTVTSLYFVLEDFKYRLVFANVVLIFTFCILVFSFFRISLELKQRTARLNEQAIRPAITLTQVHSNNIKYELHVTRTFSIILLWYVICYLPTCVAIYIVNFCHICSCDVIHWIRDIQLWFLLMSSAVNPFVYAWTLPRFRSAFLKILYLEKFDRVTQNVIGASNGCEITVG